MPNDADRALPKRANVNLMDQLLSAHPDDPANAPYLVPLQNAEDERDAHCMADMMCSVLAENFAADITKGEADRVWGQCLIDSRRMICDPEYASIFE